MNGSVSIAKVLLSHETAFCTDTLQCKKGSEERCSSVRIFIIAHLRVFVHPRVQNLFVFICASLWILYHIVFKMLY